MSAEYEKYLNETWPSDRRIVALAKEILKLRELLWRNHGHKGMYGDDGELQCSECIHEYGFYDWRRTDIDEIVAKITEANMRKFNSMQDKINRKVYCEPKACKNMAV